MAITQSDIENVFGSQFVAQWASFTTGNNVNANSDRVAVAIAWAESQVNQRLRQSPYVVPIGLQGDGTEIPEILDCKATLAGWWLWKTRGLNQAKDTIKWMTDHRCRVIDQLLAIKNGSYPLAAALDSTKRNIPMTGW